MRYFLLLIVSYLYLNANAHVFVYHRFDDNKHKSTNTSLKELRKEFEYFKNNGYEVVKLSQVINKLKNKEDIPENWVVLTIDDGYKSFYYNGLPLFKEYNYPFSLYVYVEATNKRYGDYMTWDMIKESAKYGEIGLHSYAHPRLTRLSASEVSEDTQKANEIFIKKMGFEPKSYAFPYGEYNNKVINEIKKFGFDALLNQSTGTVNSKSDLFDMNRIALVGEVSVEKKLKYKSLDVQWIEPKVFPTDGFLRKVKAKVDKNIDSLKLYVTGEGWIDIKVKNGIVDEDLNIYLKRARTRVALSTDYYTISSKIIIKKHKNQK